MIPYGYRRDKDKKLVIDEEEAKVIQRIYNLSLQGKGTRVIAEILNSEHIPTRGNKSFTKKVKLPNGILKSPGEFEWAGNTILSILRNPIYKGERRYKGKLLTEPIIIESPLIVTAETWEKVQNQLIINRNENPRNTRHEYILRKKLICGYCGRYYTGKKRTSLKDNFYQCSSKLYPRHKCKNKGISINKVENVIWSILRDGNKDFHANLIMKSAIDNTELIENLTNEKKRLEREKKTTETALSRTFELYIATENASLDLVKNLEKKYQNKIKRNSKEISKIESQITLLTVQSEKSASVEKLLEKLYEIEENFSLAKEIINEVTEQCVIYNLSKEDVNLLHEYFETKNNEFFYLEVFTYNSTIPIRVLISRLLNEIHYLTDKVEYDKNAKTLLVKDKYLLNAVHTLPISRINREK